MRRNDFRRRPPGSDPIGDGPRLRGFIHFLRTEDGLTVTEYAVAAGLVAASLTVTFQNFGLAIDGIILAVIAFM